MWKICGSFVCRPLKIVWSSLDRVKFPLEWKKANVVPVYKKNDKQLMKNYRPISLLPICGKIFERLLNNSLVNFLNQNDLISPAQSGFNPGDSYINQLLSIAHEIHKSMGDIESILKGLTRGSCFKIKVLCYLQFLKNTKYVRIVLNHLK